VVGEISADPPIAPPPQESGNDHKHNPSAEHRHSDDLRCTGKGSDPNGADPLASQQPKKKDAKDSKGQADPRFEQN
jgi:hypothetical protein